MFTENNLSALSILQGAFTGPSISHSVPARAYT